MNTLYKTALETNPKLWVKIPKEELTEELLLIALNRCTIFQEDLMSLGDLGKSKRVLDTWVHRNEVLSLDEVKWLLGEYPDYPKDILMSKIEVDIESMEFLGYTPYQILCMEEHFEGWNEELVPLITEEQQIEIALEHDYHIVRYASAYVCMEVVKQCDITILEKVIQSLHVDNQTNEIFELAFKREPSLIIEVNDNHLNMKVAKMIIEEKDLSEKRAETRTKIMEKLIPFMDRNLIRMAFNKKLLTKELLREHMSLAKIVGGFDAETAVSLLPSSEWNRDAKELANRKKQELVKKLIKDYDKYREKYDGNVGWILEDFVEAYKLYS